jgi:NAD(P)H-hydrate epimerase
MPGAAMMCVKAAVLSGSGLVTLACPESIHVMMAQQIWEKMTLPTAETEDGSFSIEAYEQIFQDKTPYTSIVIGPGLSRHPSTIEFVRKVFETVEIPIVIDGDGLFALSVKMLKSKKSAWVITPHPGEMARLFNTSSKEIQIKRWEYAKTAVKDSNGVCVLKGPKTVISRKDDVLYINPTGNPAMASGGMGDVLSGIIGGMISRGLEPVKAACSGAYIHGLAADLLVKQTGAECVSATEVAQNIQNAITEIRKEAGAVAA